MNIAKLNQKVSVIRNVRGCAPVPGKVSDIQRNGKTLIVVWNEPSRIDGRVGYFKRFSAFTLRADGTYRERNSDKAKGSPLCTLKIRNL